MKNGFIETILLLSVMKCMFVASDDVDEKLNGISKNGCRCVPSNMCADDDAAVNGEGLIDIRYKTGVCSNFFEVCCENPIQQPADLPNKAIYKGCGYTNVIPLTVSSKSKRHVSEFVTRITHQSEIAKFGELPWSTAILIKDMGNSGKNIYKCGGSLIHPEVVMTAAHCVIGIDQSYLTVRIGEWNTRLQDEPLPHQDIPVKDIVIHPNFHSRSLKNDIGLLFLKYPAILTDNIGIVCLSNFNFEPEPMLCIASGWGKDAFKRGKHSSILKKVDLPLVDRETCIAALRKTRLGPFYNLDQSFICAGGEKGKDTCKGDGGSPLVCPIPGNKNRYFQIGIVSWGIGCGEDVPGVYVNVPLYSNWIDKQLIAKYLDVSLNKY